MMDDAFYFLNKEFWKSTWLVLLFLGTIFLIVLIRYLALATLYKFTIHKWFKTFTIGPNHAGNKTQWRKEVKWSAISSFIFAMLSALCYWAYQHGFTKVYSDWSKHSIPYFIFSIVLVLFLYETYYYWLHRWMHRPSVFRFIHKVHHESVHTSVFTSFSFHPVEALLQFLLLPVIIFVIPVHYIALAVVLMLMTVSAIINHAGVEIFPAWFANHAIGKWLIGATHHDIHHKEFKNNFGLYLTFWDRWMKTESPSYLRQFEKNRKLK